MKGLEYEIDDTMYIIIYREEYGSIFPWSIIYTGTEMNLFSLYKKDTDWIVSGDLYNKYPKNWQRYIHNGQFRLQNLKWKSDIEETRTKYSESANFDGTPME